MRKIFVAVLALLLSPLLITPIIVSAQTRPRRIGQTTSAPIASQPTTVPARPPVLVGASPNSSSQAQQNSAPQNDGPEEVGEGDVVRVNTTLVTVPVSVMDRNGLYVPDLRQGDFRLYENGVEQQLAYFASVEKPFTVALVLDTSNSTHFRLEEIQEAAIEFVNQLRPDDRVMVVSFDERINVLSEATSDRYALRDAIRRSRPGGNTKLYDAVDFVMQRMSRIEGRKAVVLFTDGVDTASRGSNYQKTLKEAEEFDGLIYTVQYDTYQDMGGGGGGGGWPGGGGGGWPGSRRSRSSGSVLIDILGGVLGGGGGPVTIGRGGGGAGRDDYRRADAYLHDLANKTGAHVYPAETTQNLSQAFNMIAEELRRQYSLGYYSNNAGQAGERREIRVRVMRPNLVVRSRESYTTGSSTTNAQNPPANAPVLRGNHIIRNLSAGSGMNR
ncbi:MAG: hypothetical protein AUG51_23885 [Acidobacteria bacterium 13_1_20CM_3_53_8]|nr:MAG: hypothetical protein AUG51_23885 [Acidobacteria bacterium 13_1_20CM_3_53_8]